ncbi:MAG: DUF3124 domain-containing protein [Syntrophobacterales bacterium]|nr:DUF3124 domain-containing protein [Syntrophobacterales bacterium]
MRILFRLTGSVAILALICSFVACSGKETPPQIEGKGVGSFRHQDLRVPDVESGKVRGQVLYVPIYSNIPYIESKKFDLSAFIAIHNTDLKTPIKVTKVLYFDNDGRLVKDFLAAEHVLPPLGATNFYIPQSDKSGTGANFLVEWMSDTPVSEPLIESIMLNLEGNRGISFLSKGKVIREIK